eukprot:NODE_507_length_1334_cov_238.203113_g366_i0.p1 GENE.NODE_507_length_1334_cov_238.203113_g366_i0~~NODE_507_length_1334_cov_238.203113_g366_i0.p1  ORF type:complete len:275 (-),score=28.68 NODE_507_length_1334_cov_238.203113_g366_i0:64-888(-)
MRPPSRRRVGQASREGTLPRSAGRLGGGPAPFGWPAKYLQSPIGSTAIVVQGIGEESPAPSSQGPSLCPMYLRINAGTWGTHLGLAMTVLETLRRCPELRLLYCQWEIADILLATRTEPGLLPVGLPTLAKYPHVKLVPLGACLEVSLSPDFTGRVERNYLSSTGVAKAAVEAVAEANVAKVAVIGQMHHLARCVETTARVFGSSLPSVELAPITDVPVDWAAAGCDAEGYDSLSQQPWTRTAEVFVVHEVVTRLKHVYQDNQPALASKSADAK